MNRFEVQQAAEHVISLEAKIGCWDGSVPAWMKELSQLHLTIESLIHQASDEHDAIGEAFLKCLDLITDQCRQNIITRTRGINCPPESSHPDI